MELQITENESATMDDLIMSREIVKQIMRQHWNMKICTCWVCKEGRKAHCFPTEKITKPFVRVDEANDICRL